MHNKEDVEKKLEIIAREIMETETYGMNALLAPEPCGCDTEKMTADIRFTAQNWEKNHRGEIHGGAIASMFDTSMGMTVLAYSQYDQVSTADINVSFIRPFLGKSYIFTSEIVHLGRSLVRVRSKAVDEDTGKCLASASANFVHLQR